jgi:hypothetical protein
LEHTGYPMQKRLRWSGGVRDEKAILDLCWAGLRANAHETMTDCPYYEQLMYVGDARIQSLCHFVTHGDDRLALQSVEAFELAQGLLPVIPSRAGARQPQLIPAFSLLWILWVGDILAWRGHEDWVRHRLPSVRQILSFFGRWENSAGLLAPPPGWLFVDWVEGWPRGVPPHQSDLGPGSLQMLYAMALEQAAALENGGSHRGLAADWKRKKRNLLKVVRRTFFDPKTGLWLEKSNDPASASLHMQALSILAGANPGQPAIRLMRRALENHDLAPCSFAFQFYLFEALHRTGLAGRIPQLLDPWRAMVRNGLLTPLEQSEPSRSDCHAWSSHPLYHLPASILGLRPSSPGCRTIRVAPQPGDLPHLRASVPLPNGIFSCSLNFAGHRVNGWLRLPSNCNGIFSWGQHSLALTAGHNSVQLS